MNALIGASLGTHRFQRAGVDCSLLGSSERLGPSCGRGIPSNAHLAETRAWKRSVPRRLPIYAHAPSSGRLTSNVRSRADILSLLQFESFQLLLAFQEALAFRNPWPRGFAFQIMSEPFLDAAVVIDL